MHPLVVVEPEVLRQPKDQLSAGDVALQVDVFVLDAPPQTLHEDVVQGTSAPVRADGNSMFLQHAGELVARVQVCPTPLLLNSEASSLKNRKT